MSDKGQSDRSPRVLVVDELPSVIRLLTLELSTQGWDVFGAEVGDETFEALERNEPDVVLLEVMLPGASGFDVMREIRERFGTPTVFLTSQGTDADRAYGFEMGAADYITKPFLPSELSTRLSAVLDRLVHAPAATVIRNGPLEIDIGKAVVRRGSEAITLSTNEWAIVFALARRRNQPMPARDLLSEVFGPTFADELRYIELWMHRLREKLRVNDGPDIITGDASSGYTLHDTEGGGESSK
jgi:two-component system KDP operon response regulator KdpE